MENPEPHKCIGTFSTFAEAAELARHDAKFYGCDATVAYQDAAKGWAVFIPRWTHEFFLEEEQEEHDREFERSCQPDPNYEEERPVAPLYFWLD